ncbi:hypothetical protein WJX84_005508, partial [Apatococcus fuscideae]
ASSVSRPARSDYQAPGSGSESDQPSAACSLGRGLGQPGKAAPVSRSCSQYNRSAWEPAMEQQHEAGKTVNVVGDAPTYDRTSMLGNLLEEYEEDSMPLLWFNGIGEFWFWLIEWAIPGMGMFCEAYFIFSIGNVKQIITAEYPLCFSKYVTCDVTTTQVPDYMQIIGIVFGMITMGYIGDTIGRKWGSVMTVCIMSVGAILLTALNGTSEKGFVVMYIVSQFIFGYGVGGEYPMAAGSAAERAEAGGKAMAKKRGREVVLTFSMQGVGNFTNTAVLCILIVCFNQIRPGVTAGRAGAGYYVPKNPSYHFHPTQPFTKAPANTYTYVKNKVTKNLSYNYRPNALSGVWRISFGLGLLPLLFMIYWRVFHLKESVVWRQQSNEKRSRNIGKIVTMFGSRLLATCGTWFLWDFSFYGNKVFQSTFIGILTPGGASLLTNLLWTLLNSGIALIGYWVAAFLIDDIYYGRLRMQLFGFLFVAALFYVGAGAYIPLTKAGGIHAFQFIYFFSSFWGQFGPNCTTFLLAGELYPTDARTTCHGFSAGVAKLGALWASVWFNYLANRDKFWSTSTFNVAGGILTLICLPDPLRVSLTELDRRWRYALAGKVYHGEAINPKSLSMWERLCGVGKAYDRNADEEDRLRDLMEESGGNGALPYAQGGKNMANKEAAVV